MAVDKLTVIGWFFAAILVTGLGMAFAGRSLHGLLAVLHKLLAVVCLILLVRAAGVLRSFHVPPALPLAIAVFAAAFVASFATGVVQSIPACAGPLWLNLHRALAAIASIACVAAARLLILASR